MKHRTLIKEVVPTTILIVLVMQAAPISAAPADYANAVMADGPIGYWRLGEALGSSNAADASGRGGVGTYSGGITLEQSGLQGGDTGALFDGVAGSGSGASASSPRIIVPNSNALNPRHITMEAKISWGGPNSNQGQQRVFEKSSYAELAQYGLMINNDGRVQVEIRTTAAQNSPGTVDGDPICPGWNTPGSTASVVCAQSTGIVALNTETHIAATYDGKIIRIYFNGVFDSQADAGGDAGDISPKPPTPANLTESGLGIGNQSLRDRPFKGLIDEVALFDKVLSADRINAHYKSQFKEKTVFQYAVKFVCGRPDAPVVAPGTYFTAINVHNPSEKGVKFKKKIAVALPGEKAGPVSKFFDAKLGPDEAFEIDCPDILQHSGARGRFLKGFVVIEGPQELDVVVVYTAAGASRQVETMDIERVEPRRQAAQDGQPDLIPVPHPQFGFCRREGSKLIVTVKNQGTGTAGPSTTKVDFGSFGSQSQPTPSLAAGASVDLQFDIPTGCFNPDCEFRITVDSNNQVSESNEVNNTASGTCLG